MSSSSDIFQFEKDFAGALYCIPMAVRRKLDLCGVKVSLKQWNRFALDEREQMVAQSCETSGEIDDFGQYVVKVIEERTRAPAQLLERDDGGQWNDTKSVPQRVVDYAIKRDVVPPTPTQWAGLSALQRFAIFKLTRPGHTNENFVPAMREFGLIQ